MARKKTKKIISNDGITIGANENISLSISTLLGAESTKSENTFVEKTDKQEKNKKNEQTVSPLLKNISNISKVIVRRRTSGFGGKTITELSFSKENNIELEILAKELRKGLGCGSRVENGLIFLQGDISDRVKEWFLKKGVKKVQIG